MATVNDKTTNFALELPHPDNHMTEDCARIRNALIKLDTELKNIADNKLNKSGGEFTGRVDHSFLDSAAKTYTIGSERDELITQFISQCLFKSILPNGASANLHTFAALRQNTDSNGVYLQNVIGVKNTAGTQLYNSFYLGIDDSFRGYMRLPAPRRLYNDDGVTYQSLVDFAPKKIIGNLNIHVNALTGSDTADLYNDRGLSEEKPFKSLYAAIAYAVKHFVSSQTVTIILHSDVELSAANLYLGSLCYVLIKSDDTKRAINLKDIRLRDGMLMISNVNMNLGSATYAFWLGLGEGCPQLCLGSGIEMSGSVSRCVLDVDGGTVTMSDSITGSVAGKRYSCTSGGRILTGGRGPNAIPGTSAGTCDASSVYA